MRDGPAPDNAWSNVRNLHSQATVALHQFLHINSSWPANVCAGGCKDTLQELDRGREMVWTYRAGLAKLLARRNAMAASQTVDNYVYYVMSRWIEVKNANEYPPYPVAWNPDQSRRWNEDREASEPGTPLPVTAALDIEDSDVAYEERPGIYAPVYAKEMYPKWYAPILEAMDSESGNVTVDVQQPLVKRSAPYETRDPFSSTIRCNSTATSPEYFDCVHAFQADSYRQIPVHRGKKRENHWVAYVQSCAVNVFYHEDWDSNCNATVGDVLDYAKSILRRCNDGLLGPSGRCEGQVSFMLPNCPADIQIVHTTTDR
ncbi:hypothetical protein PG995_012671 [Apiospora arundinis]